MERFGVGHFGDKRKKKKPAPKPVEEAVAEMPKEEKSKKSQVEDQGSVLQVIVEVPLRSLFACL